MKKKQGYALGSLLLGAASWLCLLDTALSGHGE